VSEAELPILEALDAEPSLSQRALAERAGLSLSKAHFVLRRLVEKGLVKVHNVRSNSNKSGYLYILTPRGVELKGRLAYAFLHRTAVQYAQMTARVDKTLSACIPRHATLLHRPVSVVVVGEGPLSEVVTDRVRARPDALLVLSPADADVAILADPEAPFAHRPGLTPVQLV
jgi:EPS-associated MarR family transcriptional regulator